MTRSAARRTSAVQAEKSSPPMLSDNSSGPPQESLPASAIPWYWHLVLFLWATSFVFMLLYEWLTGRPSRFAFAQIAQALPRDRLSIGRVIKHLN